VGAALNGEHRGGGGASCERGWRYRALYKSLGNRGCGGLASRVEGGQGRSAEEGRGWGGGRVGGMARRKQGP